MKHLFFRLATIVSVTLGNIQGYSVQAQSFRNVYSCINDRGKPTTIVNTKRGKIKLIIWESDYFRSSGWTPQKRCEEVTKRFQKFSDNGQLKYVTTGSINNNPVICVGEKYAPNQYRCLKEGLLITLEGKDNPNEVLKNLFVNAARVGGRATTRGRNAVFNLEDYLNKTDVMESTENKNEFPDDRNLPPLLPLPSPQDTDNNSSQTNSSQNNSSQNNSSQTNSSQNNSSQNNSSQNNSSQNNSSQNNSSQNQESICPSILCP